MKIAVSLSFEKISVSVPETIKAYIYIYTHVYIQYPYIFFLLVSLLSFTIFCWAVFFQTDPKRLKKDLPKILKTLKPEDRVLIVGTSRQPFDILYTWCDISFSSCDVHIFDVTCIYLM